MRGDRMTVTVQGASAATLADPLPSKLRSTESRRGADQNMIDAICLGEFEDSIRRVDSLKDVDGETVV